MRIPSATSDFLSAGIRPVPPGTILRIVSGTALALYLAFAALMATHIHHRLDPAGAPLGYDFSDFYQAAQLARAGRAAEAYDDGAMFAAEQAAFPGIVTRLPWKYPPTFQLLLLPFAALPYLASWVLWSGLLYGAYALVARAMVSGDLFWPALLSPAAALSLLFGQNGTLSVALIGGGMLLLPRRPILAGLLLGVMTYKPHLAVLVPIVLIAGREWRALGGALASALGLALLSVAAFGTGPWVAFLGKAGALAAASDAHWTNGPSLFAALGSLGFPKAGAALAHGVLAAATAIAAAWVWRHGPGSRWRGAALATGALIVTPYLRIYDLALTLFPIAAIAGAMPGPRLFGKATLALAWIAPAAFLFAGLPIQFGPLILAAMMGLVVRGAAAPRHGGGTAP